MGLRVVWHIEIVRFWGLIIRKIGVGNFGVSQVFRGGGLDLGHPAFNLYPLIEMTGAYSFVGKDESTEELCARLNAESGWQWHMGDSYWYGDYIACTPFAGVRIRIFEFSMEGGYLGGGYRHDADVRIGDGCTTPMSEIDEAFRAVLEKIGAHSVKEIEPFD